MPIVPEIAQSLRRGLAIPAHPLALTSQRKLDERRQRALSRYYIAAGAGGLAVGVHTTQFAIRNVGLFEPVLSLAAEEMDRADARGGVKLVRIGGVCGLTPQAIREAELLEQLRYHAGLLSLAALREASEMQLISHCRAVAEVLPLIGFYLQPAVGGRALSYDFWRRFAEIENVVAVKIAPFNRYQTLDVIRAITESGRDDIAFYTGNDDSIIVDLITPFRFRVGSKVVERRVVGGLLGHWSVNTRCAVEQLTQCQRASTDRTGASADLLALSASVTDCNAVFFDAANAFRGCIAGLHEVLRRQGLLEGIWCLDPVETLSPGQADAISRVRTSYPELLDDTFIAEHRDRWLV